MNTFGASMASSHMVTVTEFTYSFAEGATGGFFDLDLTLANPTALAASITMDFLPEGGSPRARDDANRPPAPSLTGALTDI